MRDCGVRGRNRDSVLFKDLKEEIHKTPCKAFIYGLEKKKKKKRKRSGPVEEVHNPETISDLIRGVSEPLGLSA